MQDDAPPTPSGDAVEEEPGPETLPFGACRGSGTRRALSLGPFSTGLYGELRSLHLRFAGEGSEVRDAGDPAEQARVAAAEMLRCFFAQLDAYADASARGAPYRFEVNSGLLADDCVILRIGKAAPKREPTTREMSAPGDVFPELARAMDID